MPVSLVQNFYKQTITTPWTTGLGNFYISQKPNVTSGFLVISPNSASLREIVEFTATGTDGGGDFVTVSARGLGGTTEQPHGTSEAVNMNITAEHIRQIKESIEAISNAGALNASTTTKGVARLTASPNTVIGVATITIASPAVVTEVAHGLTVNDEIIFTTTGALPTGITPGVTYFVIAAGLAADTFRFSATFGGAAVNTSGSQSGVHTLTRVTPRAVGENDTRIPSAAVAAALDGGGIFGTPSGANKFITEQYPVVATPMSFGGGADGNVTISGSTTLTRDMFYNNLTVNGTLNTDGYRVFVAGTLSGTGTITNSNTTAGGNSTGSTAGVAGPARGSGPWKGVAGVVGGTGATTAPTGGSNGLNGNKGVTAAAGGTGGNGSSGNGVAGGAAGVNDTTKPIFDKFGAINFAFYSAAATLSQYALTGSGSGGGAMGQGGVGAGGGGGGSGGSGGVIIIVAKTWAGTFAITSVGANGGNGGAGAPNNTGGGGGGGGGTGGTVVVLFGTKTWTGSYTLTGGTGGAGGALSGTGTNGTAGGNGSAGVAFEYNVNSLL